MTTCTAADLRRMLGRVSPHMSTDDTLPVINSVRLEQREGYLFALATDRYTMAIARTAVVNDEVWQANIPAELLKAVTSWLKTQSGSIEMAPQRDGDLTALTFSSIDGSLRITTDPVAYKGFPRWQTIAARALTTDPSAGVTSYTSRYLSRWESGAEVLHSWQTGPHRPVVFMDGDGDFLGIHMPVRTEDIDSVSLAQPWLKHLTPRAEVDGQEYRLDVQWSDKDGDIWEYTGRDSYDRQPWMRVVGIEDDDYSLTTVIEQYGPIEPVVNEADAQAGEQR